jgi:surface-anchored protein
MKNLIYPILLLAASADASQRALREHVDIHWAYDEIDGWTCLAKTEDGGDDRFEELEDVYLPIDDSPEPGGPRFMQPDLELFQFTGVAPGEPIWIAPQIQQAGQAWPGFNNDQANDVFGSYQETDVRLSEADRNMAQPWIKLTLAGVSYQGAGSGSFSLWQEDQFGMPTVWFSTSDSTHPDTYLFQAGSHKHLNWGFGAPGIYRVRLTASAFLGPGQSNPTTPGSESVVTFAIGPFAQWQAGHFSAAELDDVLLSGPNADPDHDGLTNLTEYSFGYHPKDGGRTPVADGLGLPVFSIVRDQGGMRETITYPRRRAGEQFAPLSYAAEFTTNPGAGWSTMNVVEISQDFSGDAASLNDVWEKVTASRPVGTSLPERGFARVKVEE